MDENNQPKPPSWEEEIFESEEKREFIKQGIDWLRSVSPHPDALFPQAGLAVPLGDKHEAQKRRIPWAPPPAAPRINPSSILDSLQLFDEIVQKVLGTMRAEGVEQWAVQEDTPTVVRAVLKAVAEVSNGRQNKDQR